VLQSVGPYRVQGAVRWELKRKVLLGEDSTLGRPVWIVLRPKGAPAPSAACRDLSRPGRLRWLAGGDLPEGRWDAYSAPLGCSLADLAGQSGLPWGESLPLLLELADELAHSCGDGTLPEALSVDQVWVQPDGTIQLVDVFDPGPNVASEASQEERALALLRRTTILALEGGRHRGDPAPKVVKAPVPRPAAHVLDRLLRFEGATPFENVESFRTALSAVKDDPTEVGTAQRALHLGMSAPALGVGLGVMFALAYPPRNGSLQTLWWLLAWPLLCIVWAACVRGGLLFKIAGLALVREDNRPAGRLRACGRAALFWALPTALLSVACTQKLWMPHGAWLAWACWGAALALLPLYVLVALAWPSRSWHDPLAGTYLVPE